VSRTAWIAGATALAVLLVVAGGPAAPPGAGAASIDIYYAPEDRPAEKLIALYEGAKDYIYVAVYGITFVPVVKALAAAKRRGVDVRVITDREKLSDPKQRAALESLGHAGIPIRVNQHDSLMHLKQVVVDDRVSTSGSMNQTTSGHAYNDERLDVIHDADATRRARDKFLSMWNDTGRYRAWEPGR
jgi:phosphatidylserine/phosphatidylglycerophosphate/cardiolipin synthase-like enzyme